MLHGVCVVCKSVCVCGVCNEQCHDSRVKFLTPQPNGSNFRLHPPLQCGMRAIRIASTSAPTQQRAQSLQTRPETHFICGPSFSAQRVSLQATHAAAPAQLLVSTSRTQPPGRGMHFQQMPAQPGTPHAASILKAQPGQVVYFAFGSNMDPLVLTGRRQVHPVASFPCYVEGSVLTFNLRGAPFFEPGFGNIMPLDEVTRKNRNKARGASTPFNAQGALETRLGAGLHGVVFLITETEWQSIKLSEGVQAQVQGIGYQVVPVQCQFYSSHGGGSVTALTLQAAPASLGDPGKFLPSQRYLNILHQGAKHHGLHPDYIKMLAMHPAYDKPEGWAASVAKAAVGGTMLLAVAPLVPALFGLVAARRVAAALGWQSGPVAFVASHPSLPPVKPHGKEHSTTSPQQPITANCRVGSADLDEAYVTAHPIQGVIDGSMSDGGIETAGVLAGPLVALANVTDLGRPVALVDKLPSGGFAVFAHFRGQLTHPLVSVYTFFLISSVWTLHDWVLAPVLGLSGSDNKGDPQQREVHQKFL